MIIYSYEPTGLEPSQLVGFFEGWPNTPSPELHLRLLSSSSEVVLALDHGSKQVVGFITATTDRVLSAYIPLLEVLPEYRRRGIGSELVRLMLAKLELYYMVDLVCDPHMAPFYERFGMGRKDAMVIRRYERQSGITAPQ